jgi:hypothetical protein
MQQGTLILSDNKGRYSLCTTGTVPFDDEVYPDLHAGMSVEVYLGRHWVQGSIEFGPVHVALMDNASISGYYFIARDGGVCGLCMGMKVRIP